MKKEKVGELKTYEKEMLKLNEKEKPMIYLAGKVNGKKWEIKDRIKNAEFISSDGSNHSEHNWGWAYYEFNYEGMRKDLKERCLNKIDECDFLVAWLDKKDSYGSIAEIAYASTIGKKCFVFVDNQKFENYHEGLLRENPLYDSYWFVSHFPNVETLELPFERAVEVIQIICDKTQTHSSKVHINGCLSKIILEGVEKEKEEFVKTLSPLEKEDFKEIEYKQPMSKTITFFKRNREIVKKLKKLYNNECQICGFTFKKDNGENYSETHHIIPLGENGSDDIKNLIVVCPNCHRKLHYAKNKKYTIKYKKEHYNLK